MDELNNNIITKNLITLFTNEFEKINKSKKNENIKYIYLLDRFTSFSKLNRELCSSFLFPTTSFSKNQDEYILKTDDDTYSFTILSDYDLAKNMKDELKNQKDRNNEEFFANMRLTLSEYSKSPILHTVVEPYGSILYSIIEYQQDNTSYIISYKNNIVMKKEDYIKLFKPRFIQSINSTELAQILLIVEKLDNDCNYRYIQLFCKEMINDIKKNFPYIFDKYTSSGINQNYFYFLLHGYTISDDGIVISDMENEILDFTLSPNAFSKNIKVSHDSQTYLYKNRIKFQLLSDFIDDENIKKELLSRKRYKKCHFYSAFFLNAFNEAFGNATLVSGKIGNTNSEDTLHSWIEFDNIVVDATRNLIMDKENYYEMLSAKVINRTSYELLDRNLELEEQLELNIESILNGYFSHELNKDLERNKFLIKNNNERRK